jgi:hypothetical protein
MLNDLNLMAIVVAVGVSFGLLFGGHYAFRPPLPVIKPPWTYVYGVVSCLVGIAFYSWITGIWLVFGVALIIFGLSGAPVILFYRLDRGANRNVDQEHALADAQDEVAHLTAEVARLQEEGRDAIR